MLATQLGSPETILNSLFLSKDFNLHIPVVLFQPVMTRFSDHLPGLLTDQQVEGGEQDQHARHDREKTNHEDKTAW